MIAAEPSPGFAYHTMSVDQEPGARLATRHLLEPGHREVVHLAGPLDWIDARARVVGWCAELAAAGVTAGEPIAGDWSPDRGYEVGRRLVRCARGCRARCLRQRLAHARIAARPSPRAAWRSRATFR